MLARAGGKEPGGGVQEGLPGGMGKGRVSPGRGEHLWEGRAAGWAQSLLLGLNILRGVEKAEEQVRVGSDIDSEIESLEPYTSVEVGG